MNCTLSILLVVAILMITYMVYLIKRYVKSTKDMIHRPENFIWILKLMMQTVEREGEWAQLEAMRNHVRVALRDLDKLRHDVGNKSLRDSKKACSTLGSSKN